MEAIRNDLVVPFFWWKCPGHKHGRAVTNEVSVGVDAMGWEAVGQQGAVC
jgi:hypothetical protein